MALDDALRYAATCVYGSEGYRDKAFLDTVAKPPIWTIGHGTTRINGQPVHEGTTCTRAQADAWAMTDMRASALFVQGHVKVPLNDWQLAAMISFCYNIGMGAFARSSVCEALNLGLLRNAADRLLEYDEAGGHVVRGLDTRRGRERALFLIGLGHVPEQIAVNTVLATLKPQSSPRADVSADQLNQAELDKLNGPV